MSDFKEGTSVVIASLEQEAEERGEALAVGLNKVVQKYNFIATLYMMCDSVEYFSYLLLICLNFIVMFRPQWIV